MCIEMNSTGMANFDPRPAVAKFLQKKDRRNKLPTELYKESSLETKIVHYYVIWLIYTKY